MHYTSPTQESKEISLKELLAQNTYTLLYFYPKDDTPGCTIEAQDFTRLQDIFSQHDVQIIGVSRDTHQSHCSFQQKYNLGLALISDSDLTLHKQFGARGEKNNYGKIVTGVIRSTFLLDNTGTVKQERKNIKAKGHAEKVLAYLNKKE